MTLKARGVSRIKRHTQVTRPKVKTNIPRRQRGLLPSAHKTMSIRGGNEARMLRLNLARDRLVICFDELATRIRQYHGIMGPMWWCEDLHGVARRTWASREGSA